MYVKIIRELYKKEENVMKFFHIGDLHIGKQLYQYNLKKDQEFILNQILEYAKKEKPDAILITGDVYDRAVPSAEAVEIFDHFLTELSELEWKPEILIISGNHDSAERLEFASGILEKERVCIAGMPPVKKEQFIKKIVLSDSYGNVNFYLLPFIKPGYVKDLLQEENLEMDLDIKSLSYNIAVQKIIEREHINIEERNVILSHQFYIWGNQEIERSESEVITVGNIDSVYANCLERFDYAALGHIHKPTVVGKEWIRYCGSMLSYSVSEAEQEKGILMVELFKKGFQPSITVLPLYPLKKVRKIEGVLSEILKEEKSSDYVSIFLKDEEELFETRQKLLEIFDHILEIRLDNSHIRDIYKEEAIEIEELNPLEIFKQFYQEIITKEMSKEQENILLEVIRECENY